MTLGDFLESTKKRHGKKAPKGILNLEVQDTVLVRRVIFAQ